MDTRKEKAIEQIKENPKSQIWITERRKIIDTLKDLKFREKQYDFMIEQQEASREEAQKQMIYLKEDIYFLLKGRNLEEIKKGIDEHYDDVKRRGEEIRKCLT